MTTSADIITLIQSVMKAFPDMRVGQLIDNALTTNDKDLMHDLFYVTDEELAVCIRKYLHLASWK